MTVLVAVGLIAVFLVALGRSKPLSPRARTQLMVGSSAVVFTLLALRFGFGWLPVAAAMLVVLVSRTLPGRPAEGSRPRRERMSRAEALRVLDLADGASHQEILHAYRRVMKSAHPDHGGSTYLAAKINEARDVLLPG